MKVLVTGVAGFIGMHTAIRLLQQGHTVLGIDNLNDYYSVQLKRDRLEQIQVQDKSAHFQFIQVDLVKVDWSMQEFDGISRIVHLAAQAGVRYSLENPHSYVHSNILGFQSVMDFALQQRIPLIYASSSSVYGKSTEVPFSEKAACDSPESYYAATKRANELFAFSMYKTKGLASIGLRFFTVYGPWGRPDMAPVLFAKSALEGREIAVYNHGNQRRDFTFISDIIDGLMAVVNKVGVVKNARVYNIGRGQPVGLLDFINGLERIGGFSLRKKLVDAQLGDVPTTYADISALKADFGFEPQINLEEGLEEFLHWFKKYYS